MKNLSTSITDKVNIQLASHRVELVSFTVDPNDTDKQFYYTSAYKNLIFDSNTYQAAGQLLSISGLKETATAKTTNVNITVNGLDSGVISFLGENAIIGTPVSIKRGWLDSDLALVTTYNLWSGMVADFTYDIPEFGGSVGIEVNCTSTLEAILELDSGRYTSNESFQEFTANDVSMEFIAAIVDQEFTFGKDG